MENKNVETEDPVAFRGPPAPGTTTSEAASREQFIRSILTTIRRWKENNGVVVTVPIKCLSTQEQYRIYSQAVKCNVPVEISCDGEETRIEIGSRSLIFAHWGREILAFVGIVSVVGWLFGSKTSAK